MASTAGPLYPLYTHLSGHAPLDTGGLYLSAIMNYAAVNICVKPLCEQMFSILLDTEEWNWGHTVTVLHFWKNCQVDPRGHTILHPHQHRVSTAASLQPWRLMHLPLTAILVGVRQHHTVVLMCIFLPSLSTCSCAFWPPADLLWKNVQILFPCLNRVL